MSEASSSTQAQAQAEGISGEVALGFGKAASAARRRRSCIVLRRAARTRSKVSLPLGSLGLAGAPAVSSPLNAAARRARRYCFASGAMRSRAARARRVFAYGEGLLTQARIANDPGLLDELEDGVLAIALGLGLGMGAVAACD